MTQRETGRERDRSNDAGRPRQKERQLRQRERETDRRNEADTQTGETEAERDTGETEGGSGVSHRSRLLFPESIQLSDFSTLTSGPQTNQEAFDPDRVTRRTFNGGTAQSVKINQSCCNQ